MKKSFINKIIGIILLIILWHIISKNISSIILPSPKEVLLAIKNIVLDKMFFFNVKQTVIRAVVGFFMSLIISIPLGLLMGIKKVFYDSIHPLIIFIQSMPVISWVLLAIIWFDSEIIPVIVVMLATSPIMILNIAEGVKRVDNKLLSMAKIYKISKKNIFTKIYLPSIAGYLESSIKIVIGNTFKVVVMAEVLAHPNKGIGEKMNWARINIETAELIGWSILIVSITFIFMRGIKFVSE